MALTDKLGDVRRGHAPRRGRMPAAGHQRQPRLFHRRGRCRPLRAWARSRASARRRWRRWSRSGSGAGRSPASRISPRGSIRGCSTAASSKASPALARSTASGRSGRRCSPARRPSSPMRPARTSSGSAARRACSARTRPKPRRSACRAMRHGRIAQRMAAEREAFGFYFSAHPVDAARHLLAAHKVKTFAELAEIRIARGRAGRRDHGRAGRGHALADLGQGRRYMMATLSDTSRAVRRDGLRRRGDGRAGGSGEGRAVRSLTVELDRRAGDETPRVTIKRVPAADRPCEAHAPADDRPRARFAVQSRASRASWPSARGANGLVRFIVPLASGGEAIVVVGRDYALDAELAARIERIVGEGSGRPLGPGTAEARAGRLSSSHPEAVAVHEAVIFAFCSSSSALEAREDLFLFHLRMLGDRSRNSRTFSSQLGAPGPSRSSS